VFPNCGDRHNPENMGEREVTTLGIIMQLTTELSEVVKSMWPPNRYRERC